MPVDHLLEDSKRKTRFLEIKELASSTTSPVLNTPVADIAAPGDHLKAKSEQIVNSLQVGVKLAQGQADLVGKSLILVETLHNKQNIYTEEKPASEFYLISPEKLDENKKIDYTTLFSPRVHQFGGPTTANKAVAWAKMKEANKISSKPLLDLATAFNKNSVAVSIHENENGFIDLNAAGLNLDDEAYLPLVFQDLRTPESAIAFRAYIKSLSENFSPEWTIESYYGRQDPVPTFNRTLRVISLSFDVVAFQKSDLILMYKKMNKLKSMTQGAYNQDNILSRGPIIRMRIGDLICDQFNNGLPGYLTSLDFNYDQSIWNLEKDLKVPRHVPVSLTFNILHEQKINSDGSLEFPALIANSNNEKFELHTSFFSKVGQIEREITSVSRADEEAAADSLVGEDF